MTRRATVPMDSISAEGLKKPSRVPGIRLKAEKPMTMMTVAVAAVSGYLSIRLVRMVADKGKFGAFAYYCWAAGGVTVALSLLKAFNLLPWLR